MSSYQGFPWCQCVFQYVTLMIRVIIVWCSVAPRFPPFKRITIYLFPVRLYVLVLSYVSMMFACTFVRMPVCLLTYLSKSVIIFVYKNVIQIPLLFVYKNTPPPSANFKKSMKNCITKSVRGFVYENVMQIVLIFAKCLAFCI